MVYKVIDNETGEFYVGYFSPTIERELVGFMKNRKSSTCHKLLQKNNYRFEFPDVDAKDYEKIAETIMNLRADSKCINRTKFVKITSEKDREKRKVQCECGKFVAPDWLYSGHRETKIHQKYLENQSAKDVLNKNFEK